MTNKLILTVYFEDDHEVVSEHPNMVAAKKYLERFALTHGWFWNHHCSDARSWVGRFNLRNSTVPQATYTITKEASS